MISADTCTCYLDNNYIEYSVIHLQLNIISYHMNKHMGGIDYSH